MKDSFNSSSWTAKALTTVGDSIAGSLTSGASVVPSDENSKRDERVIPSSRSRSPWRFDAIAASEWTDPSSASRRGSLTS